MVNDVRKEAAQDLLSRGAMWADSPRIIAECCEVVLTSLPTPNDVEDRKVFMRNPKSGKEMEVAFIPKKVGDRLKEYINRIAFSRLPKFTIDIGNIASGICQN